MSTKLKLIVLASVLGLLIGFHYIDKHYAIKAVNTSWENKLKQADKKREEEQESLNKSFAKRDEDKNAQIKDVNTKLANAISELRKRPSRPSVVTVTETREVCTGAQLYREDAEFLTREAARAERIRIERDDIAGKYEKARQALERLNNGQK